MNRIWPYQKPCCVKCLLRIHITRGRDVFISAKLALNATELNHQTMLECALLCY